MSKIKETEQTATMEAPVEEVVKALPFVEEIKNLSLEDLQALFDKSVTELPVKIWEIPFTREDTQFIVHLLSSVPFKGLEAFMLVDIRNNIGDQQKELKIDSPTVEALWKIVVTKYEGRGINDAKKYVSASNKLAKVVQELQNAQQRLQQLGYELELRESTLTPLDENVVIKEGEGIKVSTTEVKKPKKSKLKLEK